MKIQRNSCVKGDKVNADGIKLGGTAEYFGPCMGMEVFGFFNSQEII